MSIANQATKLKKTSPREDKTRGTTYKGGARKPTKPDIRGSNAAVQCRSRVYSHYYIMHHITSGSCEMCALVIGLMATITTSLAA